MEKQTERKKKKGKKKRIRLRQQLAAAARTVLKYVGGDNTYYVCVYCARLPTRALGPAADRLHHSLASRLYLVSACASHEF